MASKNCSLVVDLILFISDPSLYGINCPMLTKNISCKIEYEFIATQLKTYSNHTMFHKVI